MQKKDRIPFLSFFFREGMPSYPRKQGAGERDAERGTMKQYLQAGKIINTHGVKGEIKLDAWCDDIGDYLPIRAFYLDADGQRALRVISSRVAGRFLLLRFEGCETLEQALKLKNKTLYLNRNDLAVADGSFFISDLIGLAVIDDATGITLGTVIDVYNRGASDLYEIRKPDGKTALLPAVKEFIKKIDPEKEIRVSLIEGLIDG